MMKSFMVAVEDIELLVCGFVRPCMRKPGSSSVDCFPDARPSKAEIYRIRRAFWREKLFLASTRQQPDMKSVNRGIQSRRTDLDAVLDAMIVPYD